MARSKAKAAPKAATSPEVTTAPKPTAGFYKKNGETLHFAPTAVHYPGGSILVANHAEYTYPVEGWSYYESAEAAYSAEGLPMPEAKNNQTRQSLAERITARRAMSREEREAERDQREAEHIARIEAKHPERATQLKARAEQRKERMAQMEAFRAMSPEQRRETQLAELQRKNPELAAKIKASEAARASRLESRPST